MEVVIRKGIKWHVSSKQARKRAGEGELLNDILVSQGSREIIEDLRKQIDFMEGSVKKEG